MRLLPALLPLMAACKAPCQALCDDMADFAEECGYSVSDDELKACYEDQARKVTSRDAQQVCADNAEALQEEWECDDLSVYFSGD